jgi:hypothetical protein
LCLYESQQYFVFSQIPAQLFFKSTIEYQK